MDKGIEDRLAVAVQAIGLTPHLQCEWEYYQSIDDREYETTLGDFLDQWHDRHEQDRKAGWLDAPSLDVIRRGYIAARIAIPREEFEAANLQCIGLRTWFHKAKIACVFEPGFDEEMRARK